MAEINVIMLQVQFKQMSQMSSRPDGMPAPSLTSADLPKTRITWHSSRFSYFNYFLHWSKGFWICLSHVHNTLGAGIVCQIGTMFGTANLSVKKVASSIAGFCFIGHVSDFSQFAWAFTESDRTFILHACQITNTPPRTQLLSGHEVWLNRFVTGHSSVLFGQCPMSAVIYSPELQMAGTRASSNTMPHILSSWDKDKHEYNSTNLQWEDAASDLLGLVAFVC